MTYERSRGYVCQGKIGYLTWNHANRAMSRDRIRPDKREGRLQTYRCRHCAFWHIGKSAMSPTRRSDLHG